METVLGILIAIATAVISLALWRGMVAYHNRSMGIEPRRRYEIIASDPMALAVYTVGIFLCCALLVLASMSRWVPVPLTAP